MYPFSQGQQPFFPVRPAIQPQARTGHGQASGDSTDSWQGLHLHAVPLAQELHLSGHATIGLVVNLTPLSPCLNHIPKSAPTVLPAASQRSTVCSGRGRLDPEGLPSLTSHHPPSHYPRRREQKIDSGLGETSSWNDVSKKAGAVSHTSPSIGCFCHGV